MRMAGVLLVVALIGAVGIAAAGFVYRRPQRGLLVLAAATPLHGLLAIAPLPGAASAWKEGLVVFTALCAWLRRGGRIDRTHVPLYVPWWPAALALMAFGTVSAVVTFGIIGVVAVKVTFFYVAIVVILWWAPFDARDRDVLVTVLMVMTMFTSVVGIAQLIAGPGALVALGYEYGTQVRTAGGMLRTFSTFNQPFPFGLYVMLGLLVAGAVALAEPRRPRNMVFLALSPIMVIAMASSVVRASMLGLGVGLIWLALRRFRQLGIGLVAAAVVAVVAMPLLPAGITGAFFSSSSLGERGAGWSDIISSIVVHPFGRGLGVSGSAADRMSTASGVKFSGLSTNYQPDNYYVKMLLELGPIGLWLFLVLIVTTLVWTTRLAGSLTGRDGALALGVSASIVAAAFASMVATYFEIFPIDVYFWLLLGVIGCAAAQHESRSGRSPCDQAAVEFKPISASF
jgi:putative inorganic carbon (HCO3(-)) transporter